jgi:hypothetical protein
MRLNILIYIYLSTFLVLFLVLIYGFLDWNQLLQLNEDDDKGEDLDALIILFFLVCLRLLLLFIYF